MKHLSIQCKSLADDVSLPEYQTAGSAGMDLHAHVEQPVILSPGEFRLIPSGIAISIPEGYEAQIRPRSGLAAKHGVTVLNAPGTIDSDYRGEVCVVLVNLGKEPFTVKPGERIAQMIFSEVVRGELILTEELDDTARNSGGFGHTGR